MKPVHVALLVLAGALGGAVVMKVAQRPHPAAPPAVAQEQAPAAAPAPVGQPAEAPAPASQDAAKPWPTAARKAAPSSASQRGSAAAPVTTAEVERPAVAAPAPNPAPQPIPPARTEPENVTPPPPPPELHRATLKAGMLIPVRLVDGLSSERNNPGDTFTGTLDRELVVDGFVIAERGARVEGRVVAADRGGKVKGVAALAIELTRVRTSDGQNVAIQTDSFEKHAEKTHGQDAAKVGAGAAIGAVIGAIAGGGKGAAIGAGVGGGAGAGDVLLTRGKPAALPSETRLTFRLRAPVTITERRR